MVLGADLEWLARTLARGEAALFTGAGFSADARDVGGRPLPLGKDMAAELEALCFGCVQHDSALQDLYDVAAERHAPALASLLRARLRVGDAPLPEHYGLWFAAPWARVYTLNVDDLELAADRQFALPRRPVPISALGARAADAGAYDEPTDDVLEVIHLNGFVGEHADEVTFSTLQHASRLVHGCTFYEQLSRDLGVRPFVFVGTSLDEALFWQHLQLRRVRGERVSRHPRSFLVSPELSRARQVLLAGLGIEWIEAAAADFASAVLARVVDAPARRDVTAVRRARPRGGWTKG